MTEAVWMAGDAYEPYVGRWSRRVASRFVEFLAARPALGWLDVGCGTGALTETLLVEAGAAEVTGLDPSPGFVDFARARLGSRASFDVGDARDLPYSPAWFDVVVSGLALNFIPDADLALREQHRVVKPGGLVGAYVWDYPRVEFMARFWEIAEALDPEAPSEGSRFAAWTDEGLARRFHDAGFESIGTSSLEITTEFADFDDLWMPFLGGQGAAPTYLARLDDERREAIRELLRADVAAAGPLVLTARAWAVKAVRPR